MSDAWEEYKQRQKAEQDALDALKPGDKVILLGFGLRQATTGVLHRKTPTQIIVDVGNVPAGIRLVRFKRQGGRRIGGMRGGRLQPATPELLAEIASGEQLRALRVEVMEIDWHKLPAVLLQEVLDLVKAKAPAQEDEGDNG